MVTGVDSLLKIEFDTEQGEIDLTNYHGAGGLENDERGHGKFSNMYFTSYQTTHVSR